jgi:hypothetical protein
MSAISTITPHEPMSREVIEEKLAELIDTGTIGGSMFYPDVPDDMPMKYVFWFGDHAYEYDEVEISAFLVGIGVQARWMEAKGLLTA